MLTTFLDEHRAAAAGLLDGLSEEEAALSLVPSATTVLGLVKHLTLVETIWFAELLTGTTRADLGLPATPAASFELAPDDTVASIARGYAQACDRSRAALVGHDLDEIVAGHRLGPMSLRWILLHCIRETAQHVGHGEILREQTLASRG
ncbi:DinB family protein [Propioniciclava coleopterorum]|uniref:DinB family protein n=2 Tax=Propioniciclava coleopterorum TaxID=2714937 RepID=A0A6G7YBD8_9ACTN|nr:DinB family protein [Propioniciclava coleopterorum]